MRICFLLISFAACGNDTRQDPVEPDAAHPIDAAPDASPLCAGTLEHCDGTCVNTRTDDEHCGACNTACTPAARCNTSACACPAPFLGGAHPVIATAMLQAPFGFVSGASGLLGADSANHALIITAAALAPLDTPLTVNTNNQVFAGVSYELVTTTQARSGYLATTGTVTLTRRCLTGIAGTLTNATLVEVDAALAPIPGGCVTTISQLAFDIAGPCL